MTSLLVSIDPNYPSELQRIISKGLRKIARSVTKRQRTCYSTSKHLRRI